MLIYKHYRIFVKGSWILLDTELDKRPVVIETLIFRRQPYFQGIETTGKGGVFIDKLQLQI